MSSRQRAAPIRPSSISWRGDFARADLHACPGTKRVKDARKRAYGAGTVPDSVPAKAGIVSNSELGTIPAQARDKVWNGPGSRPGQVGTVMRNKRQSHITRAGTGGSGKLSSASRRLRW